MKALLAPLAELADYEEIRKNRTKENGMIQISGCVNTQKIHLLSGIGSGCGYKLVVFSNEEKAKKAYEEYLLFGEDAIVVSIQEMIDIDKSLVNLPDLKEGESAYRKNKESIWLIRK